MFEIKFLKKQNISFPLTLCACDEVGRGPLAGPVVAGCVKVEIDKEDDLKKLLKLLKKLSVTDSKMLNGEERRAILQKLSIDYTELLTKKTYEVNQNGVSFSFALIEIDNYEIDQINILQASLKAMKTAFELLSLDGASVVLIDGNKKFVTEREASLFPIVKGDAQSFLIGLASIIAKEYRDGLMQKYHSLYPHYGFVTNMGYPSLFHREAIKVHGLTPIHRLTFRGVLNDFEIEEEVIDESAADFRA